MSRRKELLPPKVCENCQRRFTPNRYWQKYCTPRCRLAYFWAQEAQRIKALDPYDEMMAPPKTQPSEAQEAEWERRKEVTEQHYLDKAPTQEPRPINRLVEDSEILARAKAGEAFMRSKYGNPEENES